MPNLPWHGDQGSLAVYGVAFNIVPGDVIASIEVQRAATNADGSPNTSTASTIATLPPMPASGRLFVDYLPNDGVRRHYRYRHVRPDKDPSPWSDWLFNGQEIGPPQGAIPQLITPDAQVAFHTERTYPFVRGLEFADRGYAVSVKDLASSGRQDLILNGDFEDGFAFWKNQRTLGTTYVGTWALETGVDRYKGNKSIKLARPTAGSVTDAHLCDDLRDQDSGAAQLRIRVRPGDIIRLRGAGKVSAADSPFSGIVKVTGYDDDFAFVADQGSLSWATETSWTEKETKITIGSTVYYIGIVLASTAPTTATRTVWLDELHVWRIGKLVIPVGTDLWETV